MSHVPTIHFNGYYQRLWSIISVMLNLLFLCFQALMPCTVKTAAKSGHARVTPNTATEPQPAVTLTLPHPKQTYPISDTKWLPVIVIQLELTKIVSKTSLQWKFDIWHQRLPIAHNWFVRCPRPTVQGGRAPQVQVWRYFLRQRFCVLCYEIRIPSPFLPLSPLECKFQNKTGTELLTP